MSRILLSSFVLAIFSLFWSCTEEENTPIIVATEDLIYVGSEGIRATGRIISNKELTATEHGFLIATDQNFSSPSRILLGEKSGPGRFIGELSGLNIETPYFIRAFAEINGESIVGDILEFQTLSPVVESSFPTFGRPGQQVTILGRNLPTSTKVFFGSQEAQILKNTFESRLIVQIPAAAGEISVPLKVQVDEKVIEIGTFEYQSGKYTKVSEFPGSQRVYETVSFFFDNQFLIGLGQIKNGNLYPNFQSYNPSNTTWTEIDFPGNPRNAAFAAGGFVGGGAVEVDRDVFVYDRSFWKKTAAGFEQLNDIPFNSRESLALEFEGKLYVIGGRENFNQVRMYDPVSATWTTRNPSPIPITSESSHFVYQGKVYVVTTGGVIYEFNPSAQTWVLKTNYPGDAGLGVSPMSVVLGDKAYIGLFRRSSEMWELDLNTFTWKIKNNYTGFPQSITVGSFVWNGQIYLLRGPDVSVFGDNIPFELYRFEPEAI